MNANELPFEINRELCRLLDIDDYWKELAGNWMNYSAFDIDLMEKTASSLAWSPTDYLLKEWGQELNKVELLFILLYKMGHMPALICLKPVVTDTKYHRKIEKLSRKWEQDVNDNLRVLEKEGTDGSHNTKPSNVILIEKSSSIREQDSNNVDRIMRRTLHNIPKISYKELSEATDNWAESNQLGKGGYGKVYKAKWRHLTVAVKRLNKEHDCKKELFKELCLNKYRCEHILPLYGYCLEGAEACLVYQMMDGGTLKGRLREEHEDGPLTWTQRYNIMHGVARGLQFLHSMALIHGDIKPANILLDAALMPRIGDFGLAKTIPGGDHRKPIKVSSTYGTKPYLPEEYKQKGLFSSAVDVFAYGVVISEVATALEVLDKSRSEEFLSRYIHKLFDKLDMKEKKERIDMATFEDPVLRNSAKSNPDMCREFLSIGLKCTDFVSDNRPTMLQVYNQLENMKVPTNNSRI